VARITRKELKTDKFALEVGQTVNFFEEHRQEIIRYGGIAAAVVLLVLGYSAYARHQHARREEALGKAIIVQEAGVGSASANGGLIFPTQEVKDQAATKAFTDLRTQYPGSNEAQIAQYYLGAVQADQGKLADAEKSFREAARTGNANYASLAKLSLAQIYFSDGRTAEGEKTLRELMANPTAFVSKEQATITLARYLMYKQPDEARKLLDPLRGVPGAVGQVAIQLYGELPPL
jgi:predicted negative regulator of RcsB-dependent stress response